MSKLAVIAAALALLVAGSATAAACPDAGFAIVESKASPLTRKVMGGPDGTLYVRREKITTTREITEIKLQGDAYDSQILLKLTPEEAKRLHDATTNHAGLRIAFVVDDRALGAVTWQGPYGMDADLGLQLSLGHSDPSLLEPVKAIGECIGETTPAQDSAAYPVGGKP